jgi:hypothetical protein
MGASEEFRTAGRRARGAASVAALAGLVAFAGCGGDDDFANDPRPAAPIVVTAKVDDQKVAVSPDEFGAGLVNFTVSNQSDDPVSLTLVGPAPEDNQESGEIPPGGVGNLKADVSEGDYEVNGGERSDAKPAQVTVGPERPSSSDELLLP